MDPLKENQTTKSARRSQTNVRMREYLNLILEDENRRRVVFDVDRMTGKANARCYLPGRLGNSIEFRRMDPLDTRQGG